MARSLRVYPLALLAASASACSDGGTQSDALMTGRWRSSTEAAASAPGFSGLLTLDEYDWGALGGRLGVIQIELPSGNKRRFLDGQQPSRHPNGTTSFLQPCGTGVNRVALADPSGLARVLTACSSELPQPGDSRTYYGFSKLSPDATRVAVEVGYDISFQGSHFETYVYDLDGTLLVQWDGLYAPAWTPEGRLLLAGEGLYLTDGALTTRERIDGGTLSGPVNNPAVHPDGSRVVFEYNQGLWEMALDGTGLRELVYGPARLRYPAYSPDGGALVYLALPEKDYYDRALYFTDLERQRNHTFDLSGIVGAPAAVSIVPNGPLSWTR